jgi:Asp-tRNA(Asn)/Glu-tRNA(Gln) amidotransferase A subunit family amidase
MVKRSLGVIGAVQSEIAARRLSAKEVVQAALDRIARRDPDINAVVALRADAALAEATELDRRLARGDQASPLAGVPVLVKDLEDVKGMRTTMGSVIFKDTAPAERDGLVPSRLRAAGAIVVGKSNLPEFATEGYTANLLFGVTRNPWALDWTPGGSSGGSAAAIASGMVPIATATDGGGSIRIPAAFCGLVGLKPTNGVIARRPIPDWIDYSTDGPFATTVEDLRLLIEIESGPEPGDPNAPPREEAPPLPKRLRILATPRLESGPPPSPALAANFEAALRSAEAAFGAPIEMIDGSSLWAPAPTEDDWTIVVAAEHVHRFGREFVIANLDRMHPSAQAFMDFGLGVTIDDYQAARRRRYDFVRALDHLLGDDGFVLSPTVVAEGFLADGRMTPEEEPASVPSHVYNTSLANMTGNPALSLPAGFSANGVPFGLQVVGPRFRDGWLLDLAARWQEHRPWRRTAPGYDSFETAFGLQA